MPLRHACRRSARPSAKATCVASAKEKKLSGAAQTSLVKKCVADAVGTERPPRRAPETRTAPRGRGPYVLCTASAWLASSEG